MQKSPWSWVWVALVAVLVSACGDPESQPRAGTRPSELAVVPKREIPNDRDLVASTVAESVHAELDCVDCHVPERGRELPPLGAKLAGSQCQHCHADEAAPYARSVHGAAGKPGQRATCASCHGDHDILPSTDTRSWTSRRRLPQTCGSCHRNPMVAKELGIKDPAAGAHYLESIHGRALVEAGLIAAPSCVECHGAEHGIFGRADPRSTVHRDRVDTTCGQCHQGAAEEYGLSVHAAARARGDADAPVCTSCHTAHDIVTPTGGFQTTSDQLCGNCHEDRLKRYRYTYHGRAKHLGATDVAACHDCHGNHDIRKSTEPASLMSEANRVNTCRKCHAGAPANFVSFQAHADHYDRHNYPLLFWAFVIMTTLIVGTFAVWGVHTALWMLRTLIVYLRDPKAFREAKRQARTEVPGKIYVRFQPIDRFTHLLVIVSFMILVATGMPLKFHQTAWARFVFDLLGGPHVAAGLHRFGAILSFLYLGIHVSTLLARVRRKLPTFRGAAGGFSVVALLRHVFGPDSPLPNLDDLKDVRDHAWWFLGRGPHPKFDRFTYWEKFDYFAELWGSAFIGFSGLVMWFPGVFTQVLPGWIVNLAQVIHSQEALLAAGFILTFHFFNSHFRLEKFPMDTVIFSGRITEEELKHERRRQYDRLVAEGRLEELKIEDEWASWKWLFQTFGTMAVLVGLGLAIGIFYAILRYGLH